MNWKPVGEYVPEMGQVIVWLEWLHYSGQRMGKSGQWMSAYKLSLYGGSVWVGLFDCVPIESGGRHVTHFLQPGSPEPQPAERSPDT